MIYDNNQFILFYLKKLCLKSIKIILNLESKLIKMYFIHSFSFPLKKNSKKKVSMSSSSSSTRSSTSKNPKKTKIPTRAKKEPTPKSEENEFKMLTFPVSTLFTLGFSDIVIEKSKPFREADPKEYNSLFLSKVKEATKICDFSIAIKDVEPKNVKTTLLNDIVDAFSTPEIAHLINQESIKKYLQMVVDNIARPLPEIKIISPFDCGDQVQDTAWPHLNLVYKTFAYFLESNISSNLVKVNLINALITNCVGPDDRERLITKELLRKLYSKADSLRPAMLRAVVSQFQTKKCSAELLEFFNRIIQSFQAPLDDKQILIYKESVLYLHSSPDFLKFCLNLLQCINQYIKLEPKLFEPTIEYICSHWPISHIRKQVLFLSEIEGLFLGFPKRITSKTASLVFKRLADLVTQPNIDLAETAINVILGPAMEEAINVFIGDANRILVPLLLNSAKHHWNEFIKEDASVALQMLDGIDSNVMDGTLSAMKGEKKKKKAEKVSWRTNWAKVFEVAKRNDKTISNINLDMYL